MQATHTAPEYLTYGIQLWQLGCLYYDGHNYRYSRTHRAVAPEHHGRIAVPINHALRAHFSSPAELQAHISRTEGTPAPMPTQDNSLRGLLPVGSTVYTVITHESRTGSTCRVLFLAIVTGRIVNISEAVAKTLAIKLEHGHVLAAGPVPTAGPRLTASLARVLHGQEWKLTHTALG